MHRSHVIIATLTAIVLMLSSATGRAENSDVTTYKCSQFLDDILHPNDGPKLIRSMMAIAWSTGYAAAYQKDNARADPRAFRLIAATLAAVCAKAPDKNVITAAVEEVHNVFTMDK